MTNTEMSSMFDTLLNSYATRGLFGETTSGSINLDEYEKSVYLTQAQDIIVKSYFDKTLNPQGQGFDDSARRQVDFSSLIEVKDIDYIGGSSTITRHTLSKDWEEGNIVYASVSLTNRTSASLVVDISIEGSATLQGNQSGINAAIDQGHLVIRLCSDDLVSQQTDLSNIEEELLITQVEDTDNVVGDYIGFTTSNVYGRDLPSDGFSISYSLNAPTIVQSEYPTFDDRGYIYKMPSETVGEQEISKVLFILNEKLIATDGYGDKTDFVIVPINYQEYDREMSKAYAQPLKKQAWRLFQNIETGFDIYSELIPRFDTVMTNAVYRVRYVRRPKPIVLSNLDGLSIEGETDESGCELNPILHMDIVQKAVELVYATRGARTSSNNS